MRRFFSILLSGLLAWCCVGAIESSAASKLGEPTWAADGAHLALCQVGRPERTVYRPSLPGRSDNHLDGGSFVADPGLTPPAAVRFQRSAADILWVASSGSSERTSRGPPL